MRNPKYEGHEEASASGGKSQSALKHFCPHCQIEGRGNRFKSHHLDHGLCGGKGFKNYYSKTRNTQ